MRYLNDEERAKQILKRLEAIDNVVRQACLTILDGHATRELFLLTSVFQAIEYHENRLLDLIHE